ncbi:hypothetical protein LTR66_017838, partial [Elasticomyces elasticus]
MIEAAEKGESFLMSTKGASKRQNRKNYSALALAQQEQPIEDALAQLASVTISAKPRHKLDEVRADSSSARGEVTGRTKAHSGFTKRMPEVIWKPAPYTEPPESTPQKAKVLAQPTKSAKSSVKTTSESLPFAAWDSSSEAVLDLKARRGIPQSNRGSTSVSPVSLFSRFETRETKESKIEPAEHAPNEKLSPREIKPRLKSLRSYVSKTDQLKLSARATRKLITRREGLSAILRDEVLKVGTELAKSNTDEAWEEALDLIKGIAPQLDYQDDTIARHTIFAKFLKHEKPRAEALDLLQRLPDKHDEAPKDVQAWGRIFLQDYCDAHVDESDHVDRLNMTQKVLEAYDKTVGQPSTHLILPLIRSLVKADRPHEAERTYNELCELYNLEFDASVMAMLIQGYAQQQNWSRVDYILSWMHGEGLSRSEAKRFTGLVAHAFREFVKTKSPEQAYDFLSYYIHTAGTIPTKSLSNIAIATFIRGKRYNLLTRWLRERHHLVPSRLEPSQVDDLDLEISQVWDDAKFSCVDILKTCEALASVTIHEPFSNMFRAVTREALLTRIYELKRVVIKELGIFEGDEADHLAAESSFSATMEQASRINRRFHASTNSKTLSTRQHLITQNFYDQCQAAQFTDTLFRSGP